MGNKNFIPYEFTNQATNLDLEAKLLAFGNSLGLKIGQSYGVTITAPTQEISAKALPQHLLWGELTDPKTRNRLFIAPESGLLQAIIAKKLGGKFAAGKQPQPQGALGDELGRKEFSRLLDVAAATIHSYTKTPWTQLVWTHSQTPNLDKLKLLAISCSHIEAPGETYHLYLACEPRLAKSLAGQKRETNSHGSTREGRAILRELQTAQIELRVILGEKSLSLREICNLQVGQVLMLDTHKSDPINILVENKPVFKAKLGLRNRRFVLKLQGN